jgi:hypothetical protein
VLSSIFLTRVLATFAEVAYIVLFAHVLRVLNVQDAPLVALLAWFMVAMVVTSQVLVWAAILSGRLLLYFYEEFGWALIFAANTLASAYLYGRPEASAGQPVLLLLNLLFGAVYLPWQALHLRMILVNARLAPVDRASSGLANAIHLRSRRTDAQSWGGLIGLSWMFGYWVAIIPAWVYVIACRLGAR